MSVVLYTVQCTCCWVEVLNDSVDGDDLVCSVSNMTPLLWSVHVHMVSALYTVLQYSYEFFVQADTLRTVPISIRARNALQNELT